jgi:membrane protein YqaA with SNARE-associated domain
LVLFFRKERLPLLSHHESDSRPVGIRFFAAICTVASVLGGCLGYLIGALFFDSIAVPVLHAYHADAALMNFRSWYARFGVWVILVKGLTPIPYKLVTIASGAAHFNFGVFLLASLATRGARFFLEAGLFRHFGAHIGRFVRRRPALVAGTAAGATAGVVVLLRYI